MFLQKNKRAVVVGGSFAGMLAARVLTEFFEEVILIEKDPNNADFETRKGIPQGAQGHVLLKRGEEILEELFPGIIEDLIENGSKQSDFASAISWTHLGRRKIRFDSGLSIIQQSRPFLDWHVHQRLEKIPNLHFKYGCKAKNLIYSEQEVTGIFIEEQNDTIVELWSDLVVDASGASALASKWLKDSGFELLPMTEVKVDLFYANMTYKSLSPGEYDWDSLLLYPNPAELDRGGSISPIEGDRYLVTLHGYGTHKIPTKPADFLNYAQTLGETQLYDAIKDGIAESPSVQVYKFPALRRFHYDKINLPSGLLVIGDAFCRFDPLFAQGMTIAAMEAKALRKVLLKCKSKKLVTEYFHKKVNKIIEVPWLIALTEDFRFRTTHGKKPFGLSILQWYVKKVVNACSKNEKVYSQFMKVLHLKSHPASLFKPANLWSVLKADKT